MSEFSNLNIITRLQLVVLAAILLLFCVNHVHGIYAASRYTDRSRVPCPVPEPHPNGFSVPKRHNSMLQHYCNYGFKLIGDRRTQCVRGKWKGDRPVCARTGCTIPTENPENGRIQYIDNYHIGVYCSEGYDLAGNRYAYCNGTDWDRPLGNCRVHLGKVSHECDFETSDICGWVVDLSEGFKWRRATAVNVFTTFDTGPQHDHTTMKASGGHYMLMESFGATTTPAALTSPIYSREISLKSACCFQFYYFMYGAGVGNLNVYVKPVTKMLTDVIENRKNYVKFSKSGNQNSNWNEAHFVVDEMEDDFQIVFVADGAKNHLSDIAVDDVKLLTGDECKALDNNRKTSEPDDSAEYESTTQEQLIYDTLSCVSRCSQEGNSGLMRELSRLIGLCSCHDGCVVDDDCCPDYVKVCLDAPNDDPFSTTTAATTTTTTTPLPTITATSKKPTTTTKTTTTSTSSTITTTKTPTLLTTPTTTSTTVTSTTTRTTTPKPRIPSTTTSISTTTTTQKPTTTTMATTTTSTPRTTATTKPTTSATTRKSTIATTRRTTLTPTPTPTTSTTTTTSTAATKRTLPTTFKTTPTTTTISPTHGTHAIFDVTTGAAAIERKTVTEGNTAHLPPHKEKHQPQKNATKHTWEWQPKPESNPRESIALFFVFGLLLSTIILSAIYRQRKTIKTILLDRMLKKGESTEGAEDSNSIIATLNFRQEEPTQNGNSGGCGSGDVMASGGSAAGGNRLKLSLPSLKRGKQEKRRSVEDEEEGLFGGMNENDDIPLL